MERAAGGTASGQMGVYAHDGDNSPAAARKGQPDTTESTSAPVGKEKADAESTGCIEGRCVKAF
ncbi:hypothetical protein [Leyella stercorea]|uniref:hypothetical protein n=1 Tax=Leyella stercorea TaxID=363265 RepID=UPI003AADFA4F